MSSSNWYYLSDLASNLGCKETQLVEIIDFHQLPLHVRPNNWYAHLWTYTRDACDDMSNEIDFDHAKFQFKSNPSKPAHLVDPLPLSKLNVHTLNTKGTISEDVFVANDAVNSDGSVVAYFKLCDPQDYKRNFVASISLEDIEIRHDCYEKLIAIVSETPRTKPLSDNERDKLYRMIGLLSLSLSNQVNNYQIDGKPNFKIMSKALLAELKVLVKENKLDTKGLGDTNLRVLMSDGYKLLYGKKI